jgi:hypothetical protein
MSKVHIHPRYTPAEPWRIIPFACVHSVNDLRHTAIVEHIHVGRIAQVRWVNGSFAGSIEYIHCDDLIVMDEEQLK